MIKILAPAEWAKLWDAKTHCEVVTLQPRPPYYLDASQIRGFTIPKVLGVAEAA